MPKSIEEIYRDGEFLDSMSVTDIEAAMGGKLSLADLRRAYKGFETKLSEEGRTRKQYEEERNQAYSLAQQAANRIQELETGFSQLVSERAGRQEPVAGTPTWDDLLRDDAYAPLAKALKPQMEMTNREIAEMKKANESYGQTLRGLTQMVSDFGDAMLYKENLREFDAIPDRDKTVEYKDAFEYAMKNELWDDSFRAKNPNLRVPSVRKGYDRMTEGTRRASELEQIKADARAEVMKELRGSQFFPPPPGMGNAASLPTGAKNGIDGMEMAFRDLSNDPAFRGF